MIKCGAISRRSILTFCILLVLSGILGFFLMQRKAQVEYGKMETVILNQSNKLTNVLSKLLYKTQALASLIIQNNGDVVNFEKTAIALVDDPAILNVLIAPNGIVRHVYPLKGNEAVLGLNFFSEGAGNKEAVEAKNTGQLVLGGPFPLIQGGEALVGRLPIYLGDGKGGKKFWGLVSVTLKFPQALDAADLDSLEERGFAYEIWRISPDTEVKQVISRSSSYKDSASYIEEDLHILNAHWVFRISAIKSWYQDVEFWLYIILGLVFSLLIAALVQHVQDLKRIRLQLEDIVYKDPLTGLLNRRGLFETLNRLIQEEKTFSLCYLDLNQFKFINDTYGHNAGDRVLCFFSEHVERGMQGIPHTFSRIGGDEFIVLVEGKNSDADIAKVFKTILDAMQNEKIVDDGFRVSFSMGMACCPRDGRDIDRLINHADKNMYVNKRACSEKT